MSLGFAELQVPVRVTVDIVVGALCITVVLQESDEVYGASGMIVTTGKLLNIAVEELCAVEVFQECDGAYGSLGAYGSFGTSVAVDVAADVLGG